MSDSSTPDPASTEPSRTEPTIAQTSPFVEELEPGKYFWCSCGRSENQPYCDGSHKGTEFRPVMLEVEETKRMALCGCKHTAGQPLCDGSHKEIESDGSHKEVGSDGSHEDLP